jgi:SAM-dependent methyltransferase
MCASILRVALAVPRCAACGSLSSRPAFEASDWYLARVPESFAYRRCADCETVFMFPQADDATLARAYTGDYGPHSTTPSTIERLGERLAQREADRLVAAADSSSALLDVGCGRGAFLRRLRRAGWQGPMRGLEPDPAVASLTQDEVGVPVPVGTLDTVALEPGSAGTVVMRHVIEHVRDPRGTLDSAARVLAPGGLIYVATPDARAFAAAVFGRFWHGYDPPRHLFAFTSEGVRRMLTDTGFDVVAEHWDFSPQMWTGSLRHAIGRGRSDRRAWARVLGHDLNPLAAVPAIAAATLEAVFDRSTMYAATARRRS